MEEASAAHIANINGEFAANQANLTRAAHVFHGQYEQARNDWATEVSLVRNHYEEEAKEFARVCTNGIHAKMQRARAFKASCSATACRERQDVRRIEEQCQAAVLRERSAKDYVIAESVAMKMSVGGDRRNAERLAGEVNAARQDAANVTCRKEEEWEAFVLLGKRREHYFENVICNEEHLAAEAKKILHQSARHIAHLEQSSQVFKNRVKSTRQQVKCFATGSILTVRVFNKGTLHWMLRSLH